MTRETKVGLVVTTAFVGLVGFVVSNKWKNDATPAEKEQQANAEIRKPPSEPESAKPEESKPVPSPASEHDAVFPKTPPSGGSSTFTPPPPPTPATAASLTTDPKSAMVSGSTDTVHAGAKPPSKPTPPADDLFGSLSTSKPTPPAPGGNSPPADPLASSGTKPVDPLAGGKTKPPDTSTGPLAPATVGNKNPDGSTTGTLRLDSTGSMGTTSSGNTDTTADGSPATGTSGDFMSKIDGSATGITPKTPGGSGGSTASGMLSSAGSTSSTTGDGPGTEVPKPLPEMDKIDVSLGNQAAAAPSSPEPSKGTSGNSVTPSNFSQEKLPTNASQLGSSTMVASVERGGPAPPPAVPPHGNPLAQPSASQSLVPPPPSIVRPAVGGSVEVIQYDETRHRCMANDTFESISKSYYGDERYAQALKLFNRNHALATDAMRGDQPLQAGNAVYIPPADVLNRRYPSSIPGLTPLGKSTSAATSGGTFPFKSSPPAAGGLKTYKVQAPAGEKMYEIAIRTLGNGDRWMEINQLNPGWRTELPIPQGTELRLPADAKVE